MEKLGGCFGGFGIALVFCLVPLRVEAVRGVGEGGFARAFGLLNGVVAAGGLVGPLGAGGVRLAVGWGWMAVGMAACCAVCLGAVVVFTGEGRRGGERGEGEEGEEEG